MTAPGRMQRWTRRRGILRAVHGLGPRSERWPGTAVGAGELGDREDVGAGELVSGCSDLRTGRVNARKKGRKNN
jgi:hypothetical protein